MATVSVIIPTFNRSQVLPRAINSVLRQTYQDYEIIVVDDFSADDTRAVVESLPDPRILYVRNDSRKGAGAARNIGIGVSAGRYVAFLDSDDEWLPDKLARQVSFLDKTPPIVGAVLSDFFKYPGKRVVRINLPPSKTALHRQLLDNKDLHCGTSMAAIKREVFALTGYFDPDLPASEDHDFWLRVSKDFEVRAIHLPLSIIHTSGDSRLGRDLTAKEKAMDMINHKLKYELTPRQLNKRQAVQAANLGYLYFINGESREGRLRITRALRSYPWALKSWVYFFTTYFSRNTVLSLRSAFKKHGPLE